MKTSIALIGFMGAGKTAVGRTLAARLGKEFIEVDSLIEQKAGRSIPDIFRQEGESGFRIMEIEVIEEMAGKKNAVIACGGGAVLNKINIDRLREESIIVYLTASPGAILRRTSHDDNQRPLLATADRAGRIKELLESRRSLYEGAADITIATSRFSLAGVVKRIMEELSEHEGYR